MGTLPTEFSPQGEKVQVWDSSTIARLIEKHKRLHSKTDFRRLYNEWQDSSMNARTLRAKSRSSELNKELQSLSPGEVDWRRYEQLGTEILAFLFSPPLELHSVQSASEDGLDRRDAVFKIGYGHPFWDTVKYQIATRLVVAEFKNCVDPISQKEVESIQQYLFPDAFRTFGILCSRVTPSTSAEKARRRAWTGERKFVVMLSDADLIQALELKDCGKDPTKVLDVHIDDFLTGVTP
jgi:hypothetical protein